MRVEGKKMLNRSAPSFFSDEDSLASNKAGAFLPYALSSVRTRSMCCLLVAGFFTEITQQIHSLRASGVILKTGAFRHCWELKSLYLCGCAAYIPS